MADFFTIAANLLTLEINTVLKDGMSSQKMPSSEDAVVDLIENYCTYLVGLLPAAWPADPAWDKDTDWTKANTYVTSNPTSVDPAGLQYLRQLAARLRANPQVSNEVKAVLSRIQRNCDQLKDFVTTTVSRNTPLRLTADQTILLRKAWEVGSETVVMQTVIQIDGDVVTRIQPGRQDNTSAALHEAHEMTVRLSFQLWQFLVETLGRMAGALMKDLLR